MLCTFVIYIHYIIYSIYIIYIIPITHSTPILCRYYAGRFMYVIPGNGRACTKSSGISGNLLRIRSSRSIRWCVTRASSRRNSARIFSSRAARTYMYMYVYVCVCMYIYIIIYMSFSLSLCMSFSSSTLELLLALLLRIAARDASTSLLPTKPLCCQLNLSAAN